MKQTIIALKLFVLMTILTGIFYPALVTVTAQTFFRGKANGSLVRSGNQVVGSKLIAQKFESQIYFWARPSSVDFNPLPSGGSNLGPTSEDLKKQVADRKGKLLNANPSMANQPIPGDLIFASGSGLDPHISPEAARFQISRVAQARKYDEPRQKEIWRLVDSFVEKRDLGVLGEPRVNVLLLNRALDDLK